MMSGASGIMLASSFFSLLLPALEALAGGHEAVWILPEDRNMPERHKMNETSRHVDIVRWSV